MKRKKKKSKALKKALRESWKMNQAFKRTIQKDS